MLVNEEGNEGMECPECGGFAAETNIPGSWLCTQCSYLIESEEDEEE